MPELTLTSDPEDFDPCPYCGYEIMYNGPEDCDPVTADEEDTYYHDDCYADKFGDDED